MFALRKAGNRIIDRGNIVDYDFSIGDLTLDGNWNDLDLSGIIPANAKYVQLLVKGISTSPLDKIFIVDSVNYGGNNEARLDVKVSGIAETIYPIIRVYSDGIVKYNISADTDFTSIKINVLKWII